MCVIFVAEKQRPTAHMVQKAWDWNPDGGGAAWREPAANGDGMDVVWRKGIENTTDRHGVDVMQELAETLPLPFVLHFRIASSGGIRPSLTHPFPVTKASINTLRGRTKDYVLFHNGDWKGWMDLVRASAIHSNTGIPRGKWSDTRAMAWLCSIYGLGFMETLEGQKGVAFSHNDLDVFTGNGTWTKMNEVWCSNDYFLGTRTRGGTINYTMCRYGSCTRKDIDKDNYCPQHPGGKLIPTSEAMLPTVVVTQPALPAVTGGSQPTIPFRQTGSPVPLISLEVAEGLHKQTNPQTGQKVLSKNLIKKIRELYTDLGRPKKKERAQKTLEMISRSLTGAGLLG